MRRQIELSNEAAAALSVHGDQVLRDLQGHIGCEVFLRGNLVTLDGEPQAVQAAADVDGGLSSGVKSPGRRAPWMIRSTMRGLGRS